MIRPPVVLLLWVAFLALPLSVTTTSLAGGLETTWIASDPAKQSGMPAIITLDASGSASFGRLDCRWHVAPLSLGDQKYCADACADEHIRKGVIQCGADRIRLYCTGECDAAVVSVGNEYGEGQLYFTRERLQSDRRALSDTAGSE